MTRPVSLRQHLLDACARHKGDLTEVAHALAGALDTVIHVHDPSADPAMRRRLIDRYVRLAQIAPPGDDHA